jgi:hypothetical protein
MHIFKLMKSAAVEANFLAAASILILLVKISILNKYPSWLPIFFDLGTLLESILASIVAGYVFYIFVNHLQEFQRNKVVAPFILKQSQRIVGECKAQLHELSKPSGSTLELSTLTENEINNTFSKLTPTNEAPLFMLNLSRSANWLEFFAHHIFRSSENIRKLLVQLPYLPPKILALITEIEDSPHFSVIRIVQNRSISNSDLSSFSDSFYKYCEFCRALDILNTEYETRL